MGLAEKIMNYIMPFYIHKTNSTYLTSYVWSKIDTKKNTFILDEVPLNISNFEERMSLSKDSCKEWYVIPTMLSDVKKPIKMNIINNGEKGQVTLIPLVLEEVAERSAIVSRQVAMALFNQIIMVLEYYVTEIDSELRKINKEIRNPKSAKVEEMNITDKSA